MPRGSFHVPSTSLVLISRKLRMIIVVIHSKELNLGKIGRSIVHVLVIVEYVTGMLAMIRK